MRARPRSRRPNHAWRRDDPGVPRRHQRVLGRLRARDGRRRQRRVEGGHERRARLGLRVLSQQQDGRPQLLRPGRPAAVHAPPVWRRRGRAHREESDLLLRRVRAPAGRSRDDGDYRRYRRRQLARAPSIQPSDPTSIFIRCRTGPTLGPGSGSTRMSSTARRGKTSRRDASTSSSPTRTRSSSATPTTDRARSRQSSAARFRRRGSSSSSRSRIPATISSRSKRSGR